MLLHFVKDFKIVYKAYFYKTFSLFNFMKITKGLYLLVLNIFILSSISFAQETTIQLGADEIGMNEMFTISIMVKNERIRTYDNFPEIPGFEKRGTASSSSTSIVNGQMSFSQTITQNYQPMREGSFTLPTFSIKVNEKEVSSSGKTVRVVAPKTQQRAADPTRDPFEEFFGGRRGQTEYIDIKEDAFLALSTDKDQIYRGEGVTATFALYVAETNRAQLQWFDLALQLQDILKNLKPENTWEENFAIDNIQGTRININGKYYTQFKIYQATFFPLSVSPMEFPSVSLKMIKYRVAQNQSFFGANRQEDYVTFSTKPKTIKVLDLPPHPLKDRVTVGAYSLEEGLSTAALSTGESLTYTFNLVGEGNISAIQEPTLTKGKNFDIFPPNTTQNIRRSNGRVTGNKSFSYFFIPNEPDEYALADQVQFIYFNTKVAKYDTLRPKARITVTGESKKNQVISSNDFGPFYDRIEIEDNKLRNLGGSGTFTIFANALIFLMLGVSAYIMFKK